MCGRYEIPSNPKSWKQIHDLYSLNGAAPDILRAEVRPTNTVPIAVNTAPHELVPARWWLDGAWSLPKKDGSKAKPLTLINARADKLEGRFWRGMAETQRAVIPASAFWEWRAIPGEKKKQRVRIGLRDDQPFCMAGMWNRWGDALTFTVVTTEPNDLMRPIHDRMPVILTPEAAAVWNSPEPMPLDELRPLLVPFDPSLMFASDDSEPAKAA